jgi:hypothetical protein
MSGQILRICSKMLAVLRFVSISNWKIQKKFKYTLWKYRACVPLRTYILKRVLPPSIANKPVLLQGTGYSQHSHTLFLYHSRCWAPTTTVHILSKPTRAFYPRFQFQPTLSGVFIHLWLDLLGQLVLEAGKFLKLSPEVWFETFFWATSCTSSYH